MVNKFIESVCSWYYDNIKYPIYDFLYSFKNLVKWFPLIWNDRDWNKNNILNVTKLKLELHIRYLLEFEEKTIQANRLKICLKLIDRIIDDYYTFECLNYQESKFDIKKINGKLKISKFDIITISENLEDYFFKYPLVYKMFIKNNNMKIEHSKESIAFNIGIINQKRATSLMFKILETYFNDK